ncbi:MAG: hypothetical protein ACPGKS_05060 [Coraliomargarita sp.]
MIRNSRICMLGLFLVTLTLCFWSARRDGPAPPHPRTSTPIEQPITEAQDAAKTSPEIMEPAVDVPRWPDTQTHALDTLEHALRRDHSGLQAKQQSDGSLYLDLKGSYRTASMARRMPDGTIQVVCFESFSDAKDFLSHPPSAPSSGHRCNHCPPSAEK